MYYIVMLVVHGTTTTSNIFSHQTVDPRPWLPNRAVRWDLPSHSQAEALGESEKIN